MIPPDLPSITEVTTAVGTQRVAVATEPSPSQDAAVTRSTLAALLLLAVAVCPSGCDRGPSDLAPTGPTPTGVAPTNQAPPSQPPASPVPPSALEVRFPGLAEVPAGEERQAVAHTIGLILSDGPFPYPDKDGSVFGNFEGRLPTRSRGHYREYTVPTPGIGHRGARRIVAGQSQGQSHEMFYTRDHYETFRRLTP
jgi:ribonuclease T1